MQQRGTKMGKKAKEKIGEWAKETDGPKLLGHQDTKPPVAVNVAAAKKK